MSVKDTALEYHLNGYNCAQSVLAACRDYYDIDEKTALAISAGFGGGVRSGEICGAISGAVMAAGLACPFNDAQDTEAKKKIAAIASKSVDIVRDKYGCVRCIDLKKSGVRCPEIIGFMAEAAENIIKENK